MKASLVQVILATAVTVYLLFQGIFGTPAASRIVAEGGAGTWLPFGYFAFVILGPIAMMASAFFYRYLEVDLKKHVDKRAGILAWGHMVLWNIGVVGATLLIMNAGYRGGAATLPVSQGGLGLTAEQVHAQIMSAYPPYIAFFAAVAVLGALAGILTAAMTWSHKVGADTSAETQGIGRSMGH